MKCPEVNSSIESYYLTPDSNEPKQKRLKDGSRFWAVLIGIDEYPHKPLHGCVADARSIQEYLNEDLGVPNDHIKCLLGHQETPLTSSPTHDNIISALYGLVDNPAIANGDNILVYFAGAGTRYDAKECFHEDVKPIDAICPIDRGVDLTYDISLREINGVFSQISREKGATMMNTLILDCGHALPAGCP
ncbi:caspase domain-containing protein [Armillaria novae-zelandiae]|uniref:Caspase domain-containing protein n=1 Tax=Armillaria novae-zelandiae TaxID=153914 RepID=A0AA39THQ3_9AGAR|nr:caspase domain-containing protein [Armillaria novae-zelandiae]